jgi:hypothetical protein
MLLAIVALLIMQAPAVPQNSTPTATGVVAETTPAAAPDTITKFGPPEDDQVANSNPAPKAPTSEEVPQDSQPCPGWSVALTPGPLAPELIRGHLVNNRRAVRRPFVEPGTIARMESIKKPPIRITQALGKRNACPPTHCIEPREVQ